MITANEQRFANDAFFFGKRNLWPLAFAFAGCVFLSGTSCPCWAQNHQNDAPMFDSYEGTFVSAKQSSIKIKTADGDQVFRLAKPGEKLPQMGPGQGSAISVHGSRYP